MIAAHGLLYGTERDSRVSICLPIHWRRQSRFSAVRIDGDNRFAEDAHIGYWSDLERKYKTVAGQIEYDCGDRFFYEELEDGIRYIVTQKLGRNLPWKAIKRICRLPWIILHGLYGEPTRGYLVYIPRIDARNANGTYDTDVAVLSAISSTGSSYYRILIKITRLRSGQGCGDSGYCTEEYGRGPLPDGGGSQ